MRGERDWHWAVGVVTSFTVLGVLGAGTARPATAQSRVTADIAYVAGGGPRQQLDLFLPERAGFPTFLFVHGGSLQSGDRKEVPAADLCRRFNEWGFGCAATGYRLFPEVDWPSPASDVAAAVAWLHEHLPAHGGDGDGLFLLGHSSGCTLASLVATDERLLAPHGLRPSDLAGVVALGCRLDNQPPDTTRADPARVAEYLSSDSWGARFGSYQALLDFVPLTHLGPHVPPILVVLGDAERFKPPILEDGAKFVGLARNCEVDAEIVILDDRTHRTALERMPEAGDPGFETVVAFAERLLRDGPRVYQADMDLCPRAR